MLSSPVRAHLSRRERSSDAEGGVRVRGYALYSRA
jgi:hypothetical protein